MRGYVGKGLTRRFERRYPASERLPALHDDIDVLRIKLDQTRASASTFGRDHGRAGSAEWIEDDMPALGRVSDGTFDKRDRLHGRVKIVTAGLVEEPDVPLIARSTPEVVGALLPAVED